MMADAAEMIEVVLQGKDGIENKMWCLPCESTGESNQASRYCLDCDELLCQTCVDFHMKFKSTKGHKLVQCNIEDNFKGAQLLSPFLFCSQHNDRPVEVKCDIHNTLCCLTCATVTHRNCHSVSEIRQLAGGCKSDGRIDKLRSRIEGIKDCMEEIISVNDVCRNDFEMSKKEIPESLEQLKANLMKLYDRIETAVLRETQKLHLDETIATGSRDEKWKLKLDANADLLKMLNAIQEVGTESQVYVTIHKINETLTEMEKSLVDQGSQIVGQKLNLKLKYKLDNILNTGLTESLFAIEFVQSQYQLHKTAAYMKQGDCEDVKLSSDALQDSFVERNIVESSLAECNLAESSFEEMAVKTEYRSNAKSSVRDTEQDSNVHMSGEREGNVLMKGGKEAAPNITLNEQEIAFFDKWLTSATEKPASTQGSLIDATNMNKGMIISKSDTDISDIKGNRLKPEATIVSKKGAYSSQYITNTGSLPVPSIDSGILQKSGHYSLDSQQSNAAGGRHFINAQAQSGYMVPSSSYAQQQVIPTSGERTKTPRHQRGNMYNMPSNMQQYHLTFPDSSVRETTETQTREKTERPKAKTRRQKKIP